MARVTTQTLVMLSILTKRSFKLNLEKLLIEKYLKSDISSEDNEQKFELEMQKLRAALLNHTIEWKRT